MTYRILVFNETLIIATQAHEEQNAGHVLETMNPLPPLTLLTADIDHEHIVVAQGEDSLCDTDCPCASVDDVLLIGYVRRIK